jgi:hypothetical protein
LAIHGSQGRRKHQKIGGGAPASRGTLGYRKGHLKNFSPKCWRRGGKKKFSRRSIPNCTFLTKFFKKTWKFPNKKGTFDVNLVFTATLACTKRALLRRSFKIIWNKLFVYCKGNLLNLVFSDAKIIWQVFYLPLAWLLIWPVLVNI